MLVLCAPDKFRGTATAPQAAQAIADGVVRAGARFALCPLADGGEGTLDAFGGANRHTSVTGPDGRPTSAAWLRTAGGDAVIESAQACGLQLAGGSERNDPVQATTRGVGELIAAAIADGARRIVLGLGGSATTDGGAGARDVLLDLGPALTTIDIVVCCDVTTRFTDAARVFGRQKGADAAQVGELTARLQRLRLSALEDSGIDLDEVPGTGAAGGLAGGLHLCGAQLEPGFATIAELVGFDVALRDADLVITGEGRADATSLAGKVVGGVLDEARSAGVPALVVAGSIEPRLFDDRNVDAVDLSAVFGADQAVADVARCLTEAVADFLRRQRS